MCVLTPIRCFSLSIYIHMCTCYETVIIPTIAIAAAAVQCVVVVPSQLCRLVCGRSPL